MCGRGGTFPSTLPVLPAYAHASTPYRPNAWRWFHIGSRRAYQLALSGWQPTGCTPVATLA
eukprot:742148-Alexandrium_andersonii.AAC.1